jgi:uncharacterized repeat protein (TIGR03917 family)
VDDGGIAAGLAIIPVGAIFVEHFSDVEAVLTFRRNPAGPPQLDVPSEDRDGSDERP